MDPIENALIERRSTTLLLLTALLTYYEIRIQEAMNAKFGWNLVHLRSSEFEWLMKERSSNQTGCHGTTGESKHAFFVFYCCFSGPIYGHGAVAVSENIFLNSKSQCISFRKQANQNVPADGSFEIRGRAKTDFDRDERYWVELRNFFAGRLLFEKTNF